MHFFQLKPPYNAGKYFTLLTVLSHPSRVSFYCNTDGIVSFRAQWISHTSLGFCVHSPSYCYSISHLLLLSAMITLMVLFSHWFSHSPLTLKALCILMIPFCHSLILPSQLALKAVSIIISYSHSPIPLTLKQYASWWCHSAIISFSHSPLTLKAVKILMIPFCYSAIPTCPQSSKMSFSSILPLPTHPQSSKCPDDAILSFSHSPLTLKAVSVLMVLAPQFCSRVCGITSRALATARYGHCPIPATLFERSLRACASAISVAPPPGRSLGSIITFRATCMASWRLRSTWQWQKTHS